MYGSSSAPSGWQLCNGASAATSSLQAVVGSNVPDLRDRFIVAAGNSYSQGNTGGQDNVSLTTAQMPLTTTTQTASSNASGLSINDPGHRHQSRGFGTDDDGGNQHTGSGNNSVRNNAIEDATTGITLSGNVSTNVSLIMRVVDNQLKIDLHIML